MRALTAIVVVLVAVGCEKRDGPAERETHTFKMPSSSMVPTIPANAWLEVEVAKGRKPQPGDVITFKFPCDPDRTYVKRVVALAGDTVEVRCEVLYVNGQAVPAKLVDANCTYDDPLEDGRIDKHTCTRFHETLGGHEYDVLHQPAQSGPPMTEMHDFPRVGEPEVPGCRGPPRPGTLVETKPEPQAQPCEQQLHYVVAPDQVFVLGDNRPNSNDSRYWGGVPLSAIDGFFTRVK